MEEWPTFAVYKNLRPFFQSRGLESDEPFPGPEDREGRRDELIRIIERSGYHRVKAVNPRPGPDGRNLTFVYLLGEGSKYSRHGPDLRGLLDVANAEREAREGRLFEVIVIADNETMDKKNVTDVVAKLALPEPPFYNLYPYKNFVTNLLEVGGVERHTIMTEGEAETFMAQERLDPKDILMITTRDPPIVWLGARAGQYVRIHRLSETCGESLVVRRVV